MSGGYSRAEAALHALLQETPTLEVSKARRLGPDWNMREALLVLDYGGGLSFVIERPESLARIEPKLGDSLPISWIESSEDSPLERIKIDCPDPALRATFLSLIGEVLDRVDARHGTVYLEVSKVVDDWRRALRSERVGLSRQGLIGLFGELTVLRTLVARRGPGALALWRGPDGHRHDFGQQNALEVKTYTGVGSPKVTIHGAFQLDPPRNHVLHLYSLRVEEAGDGETIADIVRALGDSGVSIDYLLSRTDDREPLVIEDSLRLAVAERRMHHVTEDFPGIRASRLTAASLKGVDQLAYQLLLDACPEPLAESSHGHVLEGAVTIAAPIEPLLWFAKQFQAGDMDGTGGDRLLGRTELSPLEVLIRETAQNSWDARHGRGVPHYGIHLRRVDFRLRSDLDRLFSAGRRVSGRHRVPTADNMHILEVFDRGTTGLDGPIDLSPTHADEPRNFQDLILKVGVPRDDGKGGGTYGFGKTAAYAFSGQGTVIFWTRCRNPEGVLEHRFVASAFHESYVSEGNQFTGRHWWGAGGGGMVSPLVGDIAQAYGERFFARHFDADETGTSLLILDPRIPVPSGEDHIDVDYGQRRSGDAARLEAQFSAEARRAVRRHLWPKLIVEPGTTQPPMPIELRVHEQDIGLVDLHPGALESWGAALNAIRLRVRGIDAAVFGPSALPVEVHDVVRNRKTIGHLAVVKRIKALEPERDEDDLDPAYDEDSIQRIALMRDQAELIVTTDDWSDHTASPIFDWIAVFKSAREWDRTFADAEPPAHDMWVSNAGGETGLVIRAMRNKVRAILRETFIIPEPVSITTDSAHRGVAAVARMFGMLLPAVEAEKAQTGPRPSRGGTQRGRRRQLVSVEAPRLMTTLADGRQQQQATFVVDGTGEFIIDVAVSIVGDDGARTKLPAEEIAASWSQAADLGSGRARAMGGVSQTITVTGPARRALLIEMNASVADARD